MSSIFLVSDETVANCFDEHCEVLFAVSHAHICFKAQLSHQLVVGRKLDAGCGLGLKRFAGHNGKYLLPISTEYYHLARKRCTALFRVDGKQESES